MNGFESKNVTAFSLFVVFFCNYFHFMEILASDTHAIHSYIQSRNKKKHDKYKKKELGKMQAVATLITVTCFIFFFLFQKLLLWFYVQFYSHK